MSSHCQSVVSDLAIFCNTSIHGKIIRSYIRRKILKIFDFEYLSYIYLKIKKVSCCWYYSNFLLLKNTEKRKVCQFIFSSKKLYRQAIKPFEFFVLILFYSTNESHYNFMSFSYAVNFLCRCEQRFIWRIDIGKYLWNMRYKGVSLKS